MSYVVKLTSSAQDDLRKLPATAAFFVEQQLRVLCQYPTALSTQSYFPFIPNCQLYEFDQDLDKDHRQFFRVMFKYDSDETTIWILAIARQVADSWWGKEG